MKLKNEIWIRSNFMGRDRKVSDNPLVAKLDTTAPEVTANCELIGEERLSNYIFKFKIPIKTKEN